MSSFITHLTWLAVLTLTLGGGVAVADDGERGGIRMQDRATGMHGMDEGSLRRLLRDLDLSDDQQAQIRETLHDAREQRSSWWQEHGEDVHELRRSVHMARKADDREQFRESWAQLGELMFDAPDPGTVIKDVYAILTEAQREQLEANWQEAREQMKQRRRDRREHRSRDDDDNDD